MYCQNCENSNLVEKTSLVIGQNKNEHTLWILYQCQDCGLLKLIRKETNSTEK